MRKNIYILTVKLRYIDAFPPYGTAQRRPGSGKRKTAKTIQNHEKIVLNLLEEIHVILT